LQLSAADGGAEFCEAQVVLLFKWQHLGGANCCKDTK